MKQRWIIIPVVAGPDETYAAIGDAVRQTTLPGYETRVLVLYKTPAKPDRKMDLFLNDAQRWREVLVTRHTFPSLAMTWNYALVQSFRRTDEPVLVLNNDLRIHKETFNVLSDFLKATDALFVSGINVGDDYHKTNFDAVKGHLFLEAALDRRRGGPDFSCFVISKACHERFKFDNAFAPAYCEDIDYHRTLMLQGEGKRIFGVAWPYWHLGSGTLKALPEAERRELEDAIGRGSRAYFEKKWGGPPNHERFLAPGGPEIAGVSATTPELQATTWAEFDWAEFD